MPMESEWLELMPLTVTIEAFKSVGSYRDDPVYDDPVKVRARLEPINREIRTSDNLVHQVTGVLYPYNPPNPIGPKDRITLPDGSVPRIVGVNAQYDETEFHHYEVYLDTSVKP
jgi:hypothetical protein